MGRGRQAGEHFGIIGFRHCPIVLYGWLSKLWSLLGTLKIRCRIIIGIQKGTIILTTTHMNIFGGSQGNTEKMFFLVLRLGQGQWRANMRPVVAESATMGY